MKIDDILQSLPTREDLAKVVGLQTRSSASDDVLTALGIFGTGMLLGAGLALLFAPKAGQDLRRDIAHTLNDVGERMGRAKDAAATASAAATAA